jgi:hypothetical protein
MTTPADKPFVYFEARPKRGNGGTVAKIIGEIADIYAELYDRQANCLLHTELLSGGQWTVLVTFETQQDKERLDQHPRFQELLTDLRVYCKPAHRIRRMLYPIFHPGKRLGGILFSPVGFSEK